MTTVADPSGPATPTAPLARKGWRPSTGMLVVASAVVLYVIAHVVLVRTFPWFVDETIFATYTQIQLGDRTQRFAALEDHKGLMNTWLAAVLMQAGAWPVDALRMVAGAASLVGAAAMGIIVRDWRGRSAGVAAFLLTLWLPYLFVHSLVGVHDGFIAGGSMLALALQLSLARTLRLDRALLLGFTFGALLLSKPTGALPIALFPLSLAVFDWHATQRNTRLLRWFGLAVLALVIGFVIYGITRLSPLSYLPAPDNHRTLGDLLSDPFGTLSTVGPDAFSAIVGYTTAPILLAALWGIWLTIRRRDPVGAILTLWTLAALTAFLTLTNYAFPRYGLQMAAPLCGLAIFGGQDLVARVAERWSSRVAAVALGLAVVPLLIFDLRVVFSPTTAPYAGLDHHQYVTSASNIDPERRAAEEILRRSPAAFSPQTPVSQRTVFVANGWHWPMMVALNGRTWSPNPRFLTMRPWDPQDPDQPARFVITESGTPTPPGLDLSGAVKVKSWPRPDGGEVTTLFDRGPASP